MIARPSLRTVLVTTLLGSGALLAACEAEHAIPPEDSSTQSSSAASTPSEPLPARAEAEDTEPVAAVSQTPASPGDSVTDRFPAAPRVVAFGDVHGDLAATLAVLRIAGAIDEQQNWSGGNLVLVQTGDQLDRGDDEPEILALFSKLQAQAREAGGAFHVLNGNHEVMNVMTDMRYVTQGGFTDYAQEPSDALPAEMKAKIPPELQGRVAAFLPGSKHAREFADRPIVLVVGDTVFVHGGLTPRWADYGIEKINDEASAYLRAESVERPEALTAEDGPIWSRHFSDAPDDEDCALLEQSLKTVGASRMVVGHTVVMQGIRSACDEQVWMVDVGMAAHYGGKPAALELTADGAKVLTAE